MEPKLVIHVPHASTVIPEDLWTEFLVSRQEVEAEALTSADLYTDEMARQAWPNARIVAAEISRIVVDVERYEDDNREEMAEVGRGVMYTCDHQMRPLRRPVIGSRREELLGLYYWQHWRRLRSEAAGSVLVDLHTYPAKPWVIERYVQGPRPEIDIGFTEGLTPPSCVDAISQHLRRQGYDVGHNTPYAGVVDAGAKAAVMIEIRRDIVGKPGTGSKWLRLISALSSMPIEV